MNAEKAVHIETFNAFFGKNIGPNTQPIGAYNFLDLVIPQKQVMVWYFLPLKLPVEGSYCVSDRARSTAVSLDGRHEWALRRFPWHVRHALLVAPDGHYAAFRGLERHDPIHNIVCIVPFFWNFRRLSPERRTGWALRRFPWQGPSLSAQPCWSRYWEDCWTVGSVGGSAHWCWYGRCPASLSHKSWTLWGSLCILSHLLVWQSIPWGVLLVLAAGVSLFSFLWAFFAGSLGMARAAAVVEETPGSSVRWLPEGLAGFDFRSVTLFLPCSSKRWWQEEGLAVWSLAVFPCAWGTFWTRRDGRHRNCCTLALAWAHLF